MEDEQMENLILKGLKRVHPTNKICILIKQEQIWSFWQWDEP